jgi:hypothetical protein
MNEFLRDRIIRKLDGLSDERLYQVLDYAEFLESKYAERQDPAPNPLFRFAEAVEDKLRAGRVSAGTIADTMNLMNKAVGVLSGVAAAGKSVAEDIMTGSSRPVSQTTPTPPTPPSPPPATPAPESTAPKAEPPRGETPA